jgi:tetratricopeptide (TPR) repeat protein
METVEMMTTPTSGAKGKMVFGFPTTAAAVARRKKLFISGTVVLVLTLAGTYYFFTPKTSVGDSFVSRYLYERSAKGNPAKLHVIADTYFTEGNFSQAAKIYKKINQLTPSDSVTVERLAISLQKSGATEGATQIYEDALKANPHDRGVMDKLEPLYKAEENKEKLIWLYERMVENETEKNTDAAKSLFEAYLKNKKLEKALDFYRKKIAASPMSQNDLVVVGVLENKMGLLEDAKKTLGEAVEKDETNKDALLELAYLYHKTGMEDKAFGFFVKLASLDPNHPEAKVNAGLMEMFKGKLPQAVEIFNEVLAAQPDNKRAMLSLVTGYSRLGDNAKAEEMCRKVLALEPEYAPAKNKLAKLYMQQKKNLDEAQQFSVASMKYEENLPDYLDTLSEIYFLKRDYDKAIETMDKALKLKPSNPRYIEQMAKFNEAKKQAPISAQAPEPAH